MAESSAVQLGINGEVYRNAGSYGSPTWTAIPLVRNVSTGVKWNRSDASIRGTRAVLQEKTQAVLGGSIECRADPADAGYQALFTAAVGDSTAAIDLLILDGPVTQEGAKGIRAHFNLDWEQDQNIDGVIYSRFACDPAWHASGYPSYVEMGASSTPTITAF